MQYELWELSTGNRVAALETEAEALALVREMITDGWDPEDLSLGQIPDNSLQANDLPPAIEGRQLEALAFQLA